LRDIVTLLLHIFINELLPNGRSAVYATVEQQPDKTRVITNCCPDITLENEHVGSSATVMGNSFYHFGIFVIT